LELARLPARGPLRSVRGLYENGPAALGAAAEPGTLPFFPPPLPPRFFEGALPPPRHLPPPPGFSPRPKRPRRGTKRPGMRQGLTGGTSGDLLGFRPRRPGLLEERRIDGAGAEAGGIEGGGGLGASRFGRGFRQLDPC
jgi:hypothetical protein